MSKARSAAAAEAARAVGVDPDTVEGGSGGASVIHSREKVSLCYEIILDHFGSIAARVAAILLQRGRLTLREIYRFLANPALHAPTGYIPDPDDDAQDGNAGSTSYYMGPSASASSSSAQGPLKSQRLIQQALLTLVQHNMCWHARTMANGVLVEASNEGFDTGSAAGTEHFQMNVDAVLPWLRLGSYLTLAQDRFGDLGRDILAEVLENGKMRACDVMDRLAGPDSIDVKDSSKREAVSSILTDMLAEAYLQPYSVVLNASPRDRRIHKEAYHVMQTRKLTSETERKNIAQTARRDVASEDKALWFEEGGLRRGLVRVKAPKRKMNGHANAVKIPAKRGRPSKKAKMEEDERAKIYAGLAISDDEGEGDLDENGKVREGLAITPDCIVRVNFARFDIHLRDKIIVDAVRQRYNDTIARVMDAMLHVALLSHDQKTGVPGVHETHSPPFHIHRLRDELRNQDSLKGAFDKSALKRDLGSDVTHSALVNEIVNVLMAAEDISASGHARRFVAPAQEATSSSSHILSSSRASLVQLQYRNIARALRTQILQNIVRSQFDSQGVRVMSILSEMGKLEEKQISKLCLLAIGETRDVCARLFAAGLLSLQEVPKSNDRTPARTFFLWYVDVRKCNAWLANRLYKTLSRLAQRRRQEFAREASLVAKSHRADVAQQESMMLGIEQIRLERVRDTIRILTLAEMRTWRDLFVVTTLPD